LRRVTDQTHPHAYNKDTRGTQTMGVQPSTACRVNRQTQDTRSPRKEHKGQEQLEGETRTHFYWWRLGFRYEESEEDIEHEEKDTWECEEHIDIPSVTHEPPLLEASLIAPIYTLGERVEHTPIGSSIDEVLGDTFMSIVEEVTSVVEVSIDEVSRVVTDFSGDNITR